MSDCGDCDCGDYCCEEAFCECLGNICNCCCQCCEICCSINDDSIFCYFLYRLCCSEEDPCCSCCCENKRNNPATNPDEQLEAVTEQPKLLTNQEKPLDNNFKMEELDRSGRSSLTNQPSGSLYANPIQVFIAPIVLVAKK